MSVAVFPAGSIRLGITPTGWTNDDLPALGEQIGFEQCVSEIALAGFEGCSVGHKFPTDIDELKASLHLRGLSVSEPWHSTYFTAQAMDQHNLDGFRRQLAFIQEMGGTDIGLAELGHVDRLMADTDAAHVHLRLDTGHLYWSGDDPAALAAARGSQGEQAGVRRRAVGTDDRWAQSAGRAGHRRGDAPLLSPPPFPAMV